MERNVESSTTERAAQAAHKTIDRFAARGSAAEKRAREMGIKAAQRSREMRANVGDYIDKHPFASLGVAAAAGFLLSALLRRSPGERIERKA